MKFRNTTFRHIGRKPGDFSAGTNRSHVMLLGSVHDRRRFWGKRHDGKDKARSGHGRSDPAAGTESDERYIAREGRGRVALSRAALYQSAVAEGAAVIAIAAVYERTTARYGRRGVQYVHMDAGCAAQNVCLQATSLGLGTVYIGAFHDDQVMQLLGLREGERPLCLLPVGWPQAAYNTGEYGVSVGG